MDYQAPSISDYGSVQDITAAMIFRVDPDAEAPGEVPNPGVPGTTIDDTTGACVLGAPIC